MPVLRIDCFTNYKIFVNHWEGEKWSEIFWFKPNLKADTVVNKVTCTMRCTKLGGAPIIAPWTWVDWKTCDAYPSTRLSELFELNAVKVFTEGVHVDKIPAGEGKHLLAPDRNAVRINLHKTATLWDWKVEGSFDAWIEIDYTGTAPTPEPLPPTTPSAEVQSPEITTNPTYAWASMPFLGDLSTLFLIVIVVMIFVLIISAIRRS